MCLKKRDVVAALRVVFLICFFKKTLFIGYSLFTEKYDLLMCFIGIVSAAKFNWHKKLVNSTVEVCIVYLLGKNKTYSLFKSAKRP